MSIDGFLIEARDLVNQTSIVQPGRADKVQYFHIELDRHGLVLANGAWSETFIDDESRGIFHNASEYAVLYPDEVTSASQYCAPRIQDGERLEAIRQRLTERAKRIVEAA